MYVGVWYGIGSSGVFMIVSVKLDTKTVFDTSIKGYQISHYGEEDLNGYE